MVYLRHITKKAANDTWELVVGQPVASAFISIVVWAIPLAVQLKREGWVSMNATLIDALSGIVPLLGVFLVVYLSHLFYISPRKYWLTNRKYEEGPTFTVKCGNEYAPCSVPHLGEKRHYFRAIVTSNRRNDIEGCQGKLIKISFNGEARREHHVDTLPFEYSSDKDSISKTIKHGIPYNLDVLTVLTHIPQTNIVHISREKDQIMAAMTKDGNLVFDSRGEYTLHVAVCGDGEPATEVALYFYWTGNVADSELTSKRRADNSNPPSGKSPQLTKHDLLAPPPSRE